MQPQRSRQRRAAAVLMLSLWLGLITLAAVPQLHQLLHQDAQQVSHTCFLTQFQHQPLLSGHLPVRLPPLPCACIELVYQAPFQFLHTCDYRLALGRAPPAALPATSIAG